MTPPPKRDIYEDLRSQIETGKLKRGSRFPTERDLADQYGVSRVSVKSTIRRLIDAGLVEQKPNCRPTVRMNERGAAEVKQGRIAVWMPWDEQDVGASLILSGIRKVVAGTNRQLIVAGPDKSGRYDESPLRTFLQNMRNDQGIDGVIVWHPNTPFLTEAYQVLLRKGTPIVFIDRDPPEGVDADVISVDNYRGARKIARHLLDLGHRNIVVVSSNDGASSIAERIDGYYSALREASLPANPPILSVHWAGNQAIRGSIERIAAQIAAMNPRPTAIFAVNDQIAMYLQDSLASHGISVPHDMSIVGFDWFLRWLPSGGDLTTVAQPFEQIGETAANRLLERIEGANMAACHLLLSAPLVIRRSAQALREPNEASVVPLAG